MIACEVIPASKSAEEAAEKIAEQLGLPLARSYAESSASVALVVDMHEVWLQPLEKPRPGRVTVDFSSPICSTDESQATMSLWVEQLA